MPSTATRIAAQSAASDRGRKFDRIAFHRSTNPPLPRARRYFNRIRLEEDRTRLSPRRYSSRSRCRTGSAPARRHSFGRDRWPLARRILSWARASRPAAAAPAARGHSACPLTTQHYIGGRRSDNRVERFAAALITKRCASLCGRPPARSSPIVDAGAADWTITGSVLVPGGVIAEGVVCISGQVITALGRSFSWRVTGFGPQTNSQDAVIAGPRPAAAIAVAGEHVENTVRTADDIAHTAIASG
jgi:hypothetical protein